MAASGSCRRVSKSTTPGTPRPDPARRKFSKASRLAAGADFALVRDKGRSSQGKFLRVGHLARESLATPRIGLITSRRVGGAVQRNRTRRRLREIVRASLADCPPGSLIVIVAKPGSAAAAFEELKAEWLLLARRLSILPALP